MRPARDRVYGDKHHKLWLDVFLNTKVGVSDYVKAVVVERPSIGRQTIEFQAMRDARKDAP